MEETPSTVTQEEIRLAVTADSGVQEIPLLKAREGLAARGYNVTSQLYPNPVTALQAVVTGEADIGSADPPIVIAANQEGQDLRIFALQQSIGYALVGPTSVTEPQGLEGMRVGYHSPGSMTRGLAFLAAERFDFTPEWLAIEGSEVRVEALLNGQLDATMLDLEQTANLLATHGDEYHVLVAFAQEFPGLMGGGLYAPPEWLEEHSDFAQALVEEIILANRSLVEDKEFFKDEILRLVGTSTGLGDDPARLEAVADLHIQSNVFDVNGGLTPEAAEDTVAIYIEIGDLDSAPPFETWATMEFIDAALAELGTQ
jgi:ABC-type nitrate/sulfonate/bicarbonate transport system substrate-binding protein